MSYYPDFAALLNQQLAGQERTSTWLARRLGVNPGTVSRWLNHGARPSTPETVVRIADILGMGAQRNRLLVAAGYGYQEPSARLAEPPPAAADRQSSGQLHHGLPQLSTPFVGRAAELDQLAQRLLDPTCRLLTLAGPGGIGKTRLAIELARRMLDRPSPFADGLSFVSLVELNSAEQLAPAITQVLDLSVDDPQETSARLLTYLHSRRLLLVLDNFEHLPAGAALVTQMLAACPQVKVLVTSRVALGLPDEWCYPVAGLEAPAESGATLDKLAAYDSVRLFQQRAQQVQPSFDLHAEAPHVVRICRFVEGMPLAIELAAAWLRALPCGRIAQELEKNLGLMVSPLHNAPARHRSMQIVLEHSWRLLTVHEQRVLEVLTGFHGEFDDAAAAEVAGADLLTLAALVEKSMIRLIPQGERLLGGGARYSMHQLLRQFAGAQLAQRPAEQVAALGRHSRYYLGLLQAQCDALLDARQQGALAVIGADFDNVGAAWRWAAEHQEYVALGVALDGLFRFSEIRGQIHDGVMLLEYAAAQLQAQGAMDDAPEHRQLLGRVLARLGAIYAEVSDPKHATQFLEQSLAYDLEPRDMALVLGRLGQVAIHQGNKTMAEAWLHESLAISQACGDLHGQAYALNGLGDVSGARGDYVQNRRLGLESLAICRTLGAPDRIAQMLTAIAITECFLGEYETASAHWQESLAICRALGYRHGEAGALANLGWGMWCSGKDFDEAAATIQKALAIYQDTGHSYGNITCLADLALLASTIGNHQKANQLGHEAVALGRTLQNSQVLSYSLACLGAVLLNVGDLPAARRALVEALDLMWAIHYVLYMPGVLFHLAKLIDKESRVGQAEAVVEARCQALEVLAFLRHHPMCWQVFKDKAAQLQPEIEAHVPAQAAAAALARGKTRSLEEIVGVAMSIGQQSLKTSKE
jgi:predicted ATPase